MKEGPNSAVRRPNLVPQLADWGASNWLNLTHLEIIGIRGPT